MLLAATLCRRYYVDGESKSKIADDLGISRFQVARLLEMSVLEGIVRFEISAPGAFNSELSERLRKKLGLKRAIVIDIPEHEQTPAIVRHRLGAAAAAVLSETVTENDILGIGWGRTLSSMASELTEIARCPIVQMAGMIGSVHENSLELVRKLSAVGHGRAYPLYVPLIVEDEQAAKSLLEQHGIAAAVNLFDSITVGAVSVGSWDPPDSQLLEGLSEADRTMLSGRKVVGEVCASLFRADGTVDDTLRARAIAVNIDQLRKIKELILIAGGAHKAKAIEAAIATGLGTTLVTDSSVAMALLD
jgi:DNA-binding transcriptional regulator LsrR (DeoR family)